MYGLLPQLLTSSAYALLITLDAPVTHSSENEVRHVAFASFASMELLASHHRVVD
jgi:hypothetical protein